MAENAMGRTERNFHTRDAKGRSVRMIDPVKLLILHYSAGKTHICRINIE